MLLGAEQRYCCPQLGSGFLGESVESEIRTVEHIVRIMEKTTIAILSLLLVSVTRTFGQGTVAFNNRLAATIFSPVTMPDGTTRLDGPGLSPERWVNLGGRPTS